MYCWWDCKSVQPLWKTVRRLLKKKLKTELPYDSAIPLLGIYSKKMKTLIWKAIYIPMFIAALFTIAKTWKQCKCPLMDEWIKMWTICGIHNGILLSHKENEILPFVTTWMDLEGIILSEINQTKTNTVWFHLNVESKNTKQMNKQNQTYRYREQIDGCQRGGELPGGKNGWKKLRRTNFQL